MFIQFIISKKGYMSKRNLFILQPQKLHRAISAPGIVNFLDHSECHSMDGLMLRVELRVNC